LLDSTLKDNDSFTLTAIVKIYFKSHDTLTAPYKTATTFQELY